MENLEFIKQLGSSDFESWILVQESYRQNAFNEDIMECGFNKNTGYVYIALENGIQIASNFGYPVEFIVYDNEEGDELFFEDYEDAYNYLYN